MDVEIRTFLERVAAITPGLNSIWLIGSRANGTATESSDWDFVAFGTEATLDFLREATLLHREKIDFLVVTNGEDFRAAWGEVDKSGSLSEWKWEVLSEGKSEYMQSKSIEREGGSRVVVTQCPAIRVWPRHENAL
jgi:predicted nucleotidyltransferase